MEDDFKSALLSSTWNYLKIKNENFIIKILTEDKTASPYYVVLISDFINIWKEVLHAVEILDRSKVLNPSLEVSICRLLQHIKEVVVRSTNAEVSRLKPDKLVITSKSYLSSCLYTWKFYAVECDKQTFAEHVTFPTIHSVAELHRRQQQLFRIIQLKDENLQAYEDETGVKCPINNHASKSFEVDKFKTEMDLSMQSDKIMATAEALTFGPEMEPLFQIINKNLLERLESKETVSSSNVEEQRDALNNTEFTPDEISYSGHEDVELERKKQLEQKLNEDKIKKASKSNKKLKL